MALKKMTLIKNCYIYVTIFQSSANLRHSHSTNYIGRFEIFPIKRFLKNFPDMETF